MGTRTSRSHLGVSTRIDNTEIVHAVHERPAPMIAATRRLRSRSKRTERWDLVRLPLGIRDARLKGV